MAFLLRLDDSRRRPFSPWGRGSPCVPPSPSSWWPFSTSSTGAGRPRRGAIRLLRRLYVRRPPRRGAPRQVRAEAGHPSRHRRALRRSPALGRSPVPRAALLVYGGVVAFGVHLHQHQPLLRRPVPMVPEKARPGERDRRLGNGRRDLRLVPLTQCVIGWAGWRTAFAVLGVCVFLVLFPLTALFLRRNGPRTWVSRSTGRDRRRKGKRGRRGRRPRVGRNRVDPGSRPRGKPGSGGF